MMACGLRFAVQAEWRTGESTYQPSDYAGLEDGEYSCKDTVHEARILLTEGVPHDQFVGGPDAAAALQQLVDAVGSGSNVGDLSIGEMKRVLSGLIESGPAQPTSELQQALSAYEAAVTAEAGTGHDEAEDEDDEDVDDWLDDTDPGPGQEACLEWVTR